MRPDKQAVIKSLKRANHRDLLIGDIELLGCGKVEYTRNEEAVTITPDKEFDSDLPICYKIEVI
jgi:hypothetical protein